MAHDSLPTHTQSGLPKPDAKHLELERASDPYAGLSFDDAQLMRSYEGKAGQKVVRKIDYRLIPILGFLYLLSHIDRGNIGNAKIEGMDVDLKLTGNQYNIASTIFFVPYIIFGMIKCFALLDVRDKSLA
ncbi:MFS transporter [Colletotrichum karsti]|uniref:MFS transporter n=1 Tax=Colletotrichum karsti TaxID=1095194 RepID=A0A9P6IG22_9PEZI|nr:MFS transporter [Colletotrichum karsti]KAF9878095.1 MFS transporter [Colletotrichum karsti]